MDFDTKIKIVLRDDIEPWQELNVTAFLMSGIAGTQDIIGDSYKDKSGAQYLPMSQQPIMIHTASKEALKTLLQKAKEKEMEVAIYTKELFDTFNDADNRAMVAKYDTEDLNLVGIGIRGKKNSLDRLTKGIPLHK